MTATPAADAIRLVRRARRRTWLARTLRAVARGTAVFCLSATAIAAVLRIAGVAAGEGLFWAAVPGVLAALPGLLRARPSPAAAALLLDRAAGTKERFAAVLLSADPEVRDLAAAQALASPAFATGFPLVHRPTADGLAAVLSAAVLFVFLAVVPDPAPPDGEGPLGARGPGLPAAGLPADPSSVAPGGDEVGAPGAGAVGDATERVRRAIHAGGDVSDEEWRALAPEGVGPAEREAIEAALAKGDREAAEAALRAALAAGGRDPKAPADGTEREPSDPSDRTSAGGSAAGPGAPSWDPRHDALVRRYFEEAARRGLR